MSWLVVKFDAENTVEAVPNTWYIKNKLQCYWPSEGTAKNIIVQFIKKKRSPQANWKLYDASILGCYDDYKIAQKKANKAKNTNNLSSNNENLKQKRKRKTKTRTRHNTRSESEYESSETEVSSLDDTIYPDIQETQLNNEETNIVEENSDSINQDNVYNKEKTNKIDNNSAIASTSTCTNPTIKATTLQHKSPLVIGHSTEFEKRVIRELNILSLKIDDILENMNVLIKNKVDERESQNPSVNNKVPDIVELFPVNDQTLAQLENWLTSSEENKAMLSENLSRIGGSNVKDIVRRMMYRIFTNEVGMSYSWEGAKKKKIFKNLAVATTILSAVRLNKNAQNCTDVEIINVIKAWLVRSKDRFNNNNKNKEIVDEDTEPLNNYENPAVQDPQDKD